MHEFVCRLEFIDAVNEWRRRYEDLALDHAALVDRLSALTARFDALAAVCVDLERLLKVPLSAEQIGLLSMESRAGVLAVDVVEDDVLGGSTLASLKDIGSRFIIDPEVDGPCYNR